MPAFSNQPIPPTFTADVSTPGTEWLMDNPNATKGFPSHWNKDPIKHQLRTNFNKLCGYSLMHEMRGTVDHYISVNTDRTKAYDWNNYRYCAGAVNSSKQNADDAVFDPFVIEFAWFEIHLPSMIMKVSLVAPPAIRAKLEFTLGRLPIADTDEVIDYRAEYYKGYKHGEMKLDWIRKKIPVLAASIEAYELANPGQPLP